MDTPIALLDGLDLPGIIPAAAELEQADDLIAQGNTVVRACHTLEMAPEAVRYHLEQHPRAKRSVRRPKPRPTPALDWLRTVLPEPKLRDLYERKQLARQTILNLVAAQHGRTCDRRTLESLMHEYGIEHRAIPRPTPAWIHAQHVIGRRRLTDMAAELGVPRALSCTARSDMGFPPTALRGGMTRTRDRCSCSMRSGSTQTPVTRDLPARLRGTTSKS